MKSKISKKSKIQQNLNSQKEHKEVPFKEGSFDPSYIYEAKLKQGFIRHAKIVSLSLLKEDHDPNIPKTYSDYRYYMHFFGINRRMDDWVLAEDLKKTKYTLDELELFRSKKKKFNHDKEKFFEEIEESEDEGLDKKEQEYHEEATKVKTISEIQIGKFIVNTWYFSPFPEGFHTCGRLYFCEFCLSFFVHNNELQRHIIKCDLINPPGDQIYEDPEKKIAVFEVDGARREEYCENLSYIAKLFLDHKYIYYSMVIFNFYVLTEYDEYGYHFVGYFSKNKDHSDVLPCHQKKGYGKFLINFSYELSQVEKRIGTPERPLSDLGKLAYMKYWAQRIIEYLQKLTDEQLQTMTIKQISENTSIREQDIVDALEERKILKMVNGKIYMCLERNLLQTIYKQMGRPATKVHLDKLHWVPRIEKFETFN